MGNKTAMQEALEIIRLAREGEIDNDLRSIKYRIEGLLEKEKQQIIVANCEGYYEGANAEIGSFKDAESYYNETYKQTTE